MTSTETFPIDLTLLKALKLDPSRPTLSAEQKQALLHNIGLCRDAIVFFTAVADAKGLGGHTGGAYDTTPEVQIIRGFIAGGAPILPIFFDEAGHRVATQYLLSVLEGEMPAEKLLHYREYNQHLPGHPERGFTPGVKFSSGRLGHLWAYANGVAMANPDKAVFVLGSDGSQMEGDDAEAARLAVAKNINIKLIIDDNDVTIAGYPSKYLPGFDVAKTLAGHGMSVQTVQGEDIDALYAALARAFVTQGPQAVVVRRKMAPGIDGLEGHNHAHESIKASLAIPYLEKRGHHKAAEYLKNVKPQKNPLVHRGSSGAGKNRDEFGKIINSILDGMTPQQRLASVRVFDNDLEGSCGLHHIRKKYPEVYVSAGIMERGNFSAAAGFGMNPGRQGIYGTFSAFLEMVISEITMARLNHSNVLAHFSHAGVDDMADNTCHFGLNNLFADNGLPDEGRDTTRLYFPADQHQFAACIRRIFNDPGLRFVFSTRAAVPDILTEDGKLFYGQGYQFTPGKDEIIRAAPAGGGYVVSFGETLYRALDAVIRLQESGVKVGLINKPTLNVIDPQMMAMLKDAPFVLVAEGFNIKTGLGSRFGTALLKAGFKGRYNHIGTHREGSGGLWEQMGYQGVDSEGIARAVRELA
ncbi:transketolase C-terminal domain-containing protein [Fontivita pretiosa]|uniref:transketolase C-terminal domain-containing protein n=1 Tax=Fontivita pretiosa TaxID=2989684 RepID=UPI003D185E4E